MTGNQEAFQKAMNMGHSAAWEQQWEQAGKYYRQALEEIPDQPSALTSLALALFELQQYEEALRYYLRAAKITPSDPVPLEKVAQIYQLQGKTTEAVQAWLQAAELQIKAQEGPKAVKDLIGVLMLQSENLNARTRLGMIYDRTGRKADAVKEYLAAAAIIQRSGDLAKAVQLAEYALQLQPENPDARKAAAMIKAGQMLPRPARPKGVTGPMRPLEARKSEAPKEAAPAPAGQDPVAQARQSALAQLAAILFDQAEEGSQSHQRRGFAALSRGIPGLSDEHTRTRILLHLSQAIESQTHGHDAQAAVELERAADAGLNHPAVNFMLGLLAGKSDRAKAMRYLQESVKNPEFDIASSLLIGQYHEDQSELRAAAGAYLQALRSADLLTAAANQREELDQAYEPLLEGLSNIEDESRFKAICEAVSGQLMRPDWREILKAARQQMAAQTAGGIMPLAEMLLETRGGQVVELLTRVRQLAGQNRYRTAMEEAFYALQFAPTYLPLHVQIGEMLLKDNHTQAAVTKFLMVANLYSLRGEAAQAVRLLERVMQSVPADVSIRMALIDLLAAQGRQEEAVRQYISLAEFYYQIADMDKARQTYLLALRLPLQGKNGRALSVDVLHRVADIDLQRLDMRQALKIYEQIRGLMPEDQPARLKLVELNLRLSQDEAALSELDGYIGYLENLNQRPKAVQFVEGLLKDRPERMDMRKRLADLYQRGGQVEKAVEQLDGIADALLAARNKPAALTILESIVALNPPNAGEYRAALAKLKAQ